MIFLLFLFLISHGWAQASQQPGWIDNPGLFYPKEEYLVGVGEGETRKRAEDQTYAAISRIFQAKVSDQFKSFERSLESESGGKNRISRHIEIEQLTTMSTEKTLEDVAISETWFDPDTKTYYALAILNRSHASASLKDKIAQLDSEAAQALQQAQKTQEKRIRLKNLKRALNAILLREGYNMDLMIIDPSGKGIANPLDPLKVINGFDQFVAGSFSVAILLAGPYSGQIKESLSEEITGRLGLPLVSVSSPSIDVSIAGRIEMEEAKTSSSSEFKFLQWRVTIHLLDEVGKEFGTITRSGREGHRSRQEAEQVVVRSIRQEIKKEVGEKLTRFLFGDIP